MKIAVTYEEGNVFQHFGKSHTFKMYEIENDQVVSSEVIGSNGAGHSALAGFLAEQNVDVLICGGIGGGAKDALKGVGVEIFSGVQGDADQAVDAFLKGELETSDVTCNHHHEDGHDCGEHDHDCGGHDCGEHDHDCSDHDCGGNCGGGCGGCGGRQMITGPNAGRYCRAHYIGTFNDGSVFDSSYDHGEPLEFMCGVGQMIRGFDEAVANMEIGQITEIHLMPEEAYGVWNPNAVFTVAFTDLPGSENLEIGNQVYLTNTMGQQFLSTVTEKTETTITFDANHEMAGKELNFKIELIDVL